MAYRDLKTFSCSLDHKNRLFVRVRVLLLLPLFLRIYC